MGKETLKTKSWEWSQDTLSSKVEKGEEEGHKTDGLTTQVPAGCSQGSVPLGCPRGGVETSQVVPPKELAIHLLLPVIGRSLLQGM